MNWGRSYQVKDEPETCDDLMQNEYKLMRHILVKHALTNSDYVWLEECTACILDM